MLACSQSSNSLELFAAFEYCKKKKKKVTFNMQMNYWYPQEQVLGISKFSSEFPSIRGNLLILEAVYSSGTFLTSIFFHLSSSGWFHSVNLTAPGNSAKDV